MRYYYTFTSKARDKEKDPTSSTVEDVGAGVSHMLRLQNGTVILENNLATPYKTPHSIAIWARD